VSGICKGKLASHMRAGYHQPPTAMPRRRRPHLPIYDNERDKKTADCQKLLSQSAQSRNQSLADTVKTSCVLVTSPSDTSSDASRQEEKEEGGGEEESKGKSPILLVRSCAEL